MKTAAIASALAAMLITPAQAKAETRREHDSHIHGVSSLTIAIEGKLVEMALEAPGMDLVGFEHEAKSAEDRQRVALALATLQKGDTLFVLPPDAGCSLERAEAALHGSDEHDDHAKDDDHDHGSTESNHTEFAATYRFGCADPDRIGRIEFPFFTQFPLSVELDIQAVTSNGAFAFEATRDDPVVSLPLRD